MQNFFINFRQKKCLIFLFFKKCIIFINFVECKHTLRNKFVHRNVRAYLYVSMLLYAIKNILLDVYNDGF